MYIREKVSTAVDCSMNGSNTIDEYTFDENKEVIEALSRLVAAIGRNDKIAAIKFLRSNYGCGLRFGKAFTEESMAIYND